MSSLLRLGVFVNDPHSLDRMCFCLGLKQVEICYLEDSSGNTQPKNPYLMDGSIMIEYDFQEIMVRDKKNV